MKTEQDLLLERKQLIKEFQESTIETNRIKSEIRLVEEKIKIARKKAA